MVNKLNIAVLMGGNSTEHEISLMSGREVVQNLNSNRYNVFPINISRNGKKWLMGDKKNYITSPTQKITEGLRGNLTIKSDNSKTSIFKENKIDFIFIALHGTYGEDGSVQGFLDLLNIPYSGSGVLASALSMHKEHSRQVLASNGFNVPRYLVFNKKDKVNKILNRFKYPFIVKPPNQGSSIGISKVNHRKQLDTALLSAFKYSDEILIEDFISGTEITGSILGNRHPESLPLVEIVPKNDFFDFEAKYDESKCDEICPARISKKLTLEAQEISLKVYRLLGLKGFGRIDMIIRKNQIFVLEANTIPGLSSLSLFPKAAKEYGLSYSKLLDKIISYSLLEAGRIKSMNSTQVYGEIDKWKRPIHFTKSKLAKIYLNLIPNLKVIAKNRKSTNS